MIIRRLGLRDYRQFENLDLRLTPGLTVVKGPNEAGKSTVLSALLLALFGDAKSQAHEISQRKRWGSDRLFRVEMDFEQDDRSWSLERDYEAKTQRLVDVVSGEQIDDRAAIAAKVSEELGFGSEDLFKSTACVTQSSIALISKNGRQQISDQLQSVMTGGGADTVAAQAVASLTAQAADLRRGLDHPAKNSGAIKEAADDVSRLEAELESRKGNATRAHDAADTVADADEAIRARSERLNAVRELLANYDKRSRLIENRDNASRSEDALQAEIESAEKLRAAIREKKDAVHSFRKFNEMPPDTPQVIATLEATLRVHASAERDIEAEVERATAAERSTHTPWRYLPLIGLICSLIVAAWLLIARNYGGSVFPGIMAAIFLVLCRSRHIADKDVYRRADESEEKLERIRSQIRLTYDEQQQLVKSSGCESVDDLRRRWSEWTLLRTEMARMEAEMAGKLAGRDISQMERERKGFAKARRDADDQLDSPEMRTANLSPLDCQQLALESRRLETEIADLQNQRTMARALIQTIDADPTAVYEIEESLEFARERLARAERLARVYTMAAEGIKEAIGQTLSGAKPLLEDEVGKRLSAITGGKYNRVEVDENSLDFSIFSNEKGAMLDMSDGELSRGALDQFYLAARVALLDLVCGSAKPPILLDDPFVTFDDERAGRAMELLKDAAHGRQAILFTCSDRCDRYADHLIDLTH